jgi:hypothetical protein
LKIEGRGYRAQRTNADVEKDLIDNVFLAIKTNAFMLSVQDVYDHLAKYSTVPESWRIKNYTFDFVDCIISVIEKQILDELHKFQFHMLIVDESTAFHSSQYL